MRDLRSSQTLGVLAGTLLLAIGLATSPAGAASTVDVTYDLSDSSLEMLWGRDLDKVVTVADGTQNGTIGGTMKVRYASNSSSGMPIVTGAVSILSLDLNADWSLQTLRFSGTATTKSFAGPEVSGTLNWHLGGGPVAGSILSGGTLTGLTGALEMTGRVHCLADQVYGSGACQFLLGLQYSIPVYPVRTASGPLDLAGMTGTYAGTTTRHTVTGGNALPGVRFGVFAASGGYTHNGYGGVQLVGREVRREADGHETRVIPEPGTLLLLGSGAVGLGLLSRRRARRD